ncbi:MAG: Hsp20/alpha crystallin family protein [Pseudomonadota bacterium]
MQRNIQKTSIPNLHAGEQIILQSQGAYKHNFRSGWKVARCLLTIQRLIMYQRPSIRFEVPLDDIKGVTIENLHYVIRKRECLSLSYKAGEGSRDGRIWFIANDLEDWRKRIISQAALLKVDLETIEKISLQLDSDSQDILWYLWMNRHAKIDRLEALIDAPNHMHVLLKIRETINPVAEKIVGIPILSFERSKVDPETGEKILFSWWLMGQQEKLVQSEERLLDIFDEGSHIQVIMEVKGVEESDVRLEVSGEQLTVSSVMPDSVWKEVILLPAEVNTDNYQLHIKNNLLEIKLHRDSFKTLQRVNFDPAKAGDKPQEIVSMRNRRNGMDSRN